MPYDFRIYIDRGNGTSDQNNIVGFIVTVNGARVGVFPTIAIANSEVRLELRKIENEMNSPGVHGTGDIDKILERYGSKVTWDSDFATTFNSTSGSIPET